MSTTSPQKSQLELRFAELSTVAEQVAARQHQVNTAATGRAQAFGELETLPGQFEVWQKAATQNCENLIGAVSLPVGVAGPLVYQSRYQSQNWQERQALLPLATTEAALVASVNRGAKALRESGEAKVWSKKIGMSRAPVFECPSGWQAEQFGAWLDQHQIELWQMIEASSQHLRVLEWRWWVRGRYLYLRVVCDTGEAMGMNMISIGIQNMWAELKSRFSDESMLSGVEMLSLSSNICTDKKDSTVNRLLGRGYWAQAEAVVPATVVRDVLRAEPARVMQVQLAKNLVGSNLAGSASANMHAANVAAALLIAWGQDPAHVVEAAQATTSLELLPNGNIYVAITAPNLNLGSVGGGTWLPAQTQARAMAGIASDSPNAQELAEIMTMGMLAAELSGLSALASNHLACAHQALRGGT